MDIFLKVTNGNYKYKISENLFDNKEEHVKKIFNYFGEIINFILMNFL